MKKTNSILPDELFREKFISGEVPFEPASWEHMKTLLDEDDINPVWIVPPQKNNDNKTTLFIIIMTTLSIFSLATWMLLGTNKIAAEMDTRKDIAVSAKAQDAKSGDRSALKSYKDKKSTTPVERGSAQSNSTLFTQVMRTEKEIAAGQTPKDNSSTDFTVTDNGPFKDSVRMVTAEGKTYRVFTRKIWVPEEYEYIEKPRSKTVDDFWIGLHFTAQRPFQNDTVMPESGGFNMQFMSGNRLKNKSWALYGGVDWGMQFYGKSKKTNVVLNNTTQDSGFTRLRTWSMDFLGRAHFEYARFALVPYVNVFAGPRIYSTGQTVSSYLELKQTESSTTHNAHTSVSMLYGVGLGARLRISPYVSLDARYELMSGTPVNLVDMNRSTFNGLSYNLKMNKVTPFNEQFKVGVIFDISSGEYDKKLVKEGYYKEYMYDSLYVDPRDTNKIYLPCNCPCDNDNKSSMEQHSRIYEDHATPPYQQGGTRGGSNSGGSNGGGSGGSKGSFPGIKPPTTPTPKDNR